MTYVDAFYDKPHDTVKLVERVNGKRIITDYRPEYNFYIADSNGTKRSIYGQRVSEIRCKGYKDFRQNLGIYSHSPKFESDIKPVNKILERNFLHADTPKLQVAFLDIEVDFDPVRGYASPEEAFMPITSIGVYLQWSDTMACLAVPPKTLTMDEAMQMTKDMPEVILFETEKAMLEAFFTLIDDADIISGWNSEGYDIPYMVNRVRQCMGKAELRKFCLFDQFPKERKYINHGKEAQTYDLIGRVHLDYMQLYIKYNYEERHSYRLDFIGEMEVGEKKVEYEGSLDRLYNYDFQRFLEYNIQDVMLLHKLDTKLQFIDLVNTIAHDNTILLPTTMGAVATTEQAIINEAHRRNLVVPDRIRNYGGLDDSRVAGAYVATPVSGYHEWIGSSDLNSLYPSVFRALNMAPETIVGQVRTHLTDEEIEEKMVLHKMKFADAWAGKFGTNEFELVAARDVDVPLFLDLEDGSSLECNGAEIYHLVFNSGQPWNISANGTIFRTDKQGIIPGLLERWYAERKELQAKKKEAEAANDKEMISFWDKRQLVKKINLNSLYGAILNGGCRFFDRRIGQSTTLTGRRITRHMAAETNRMITGTYDHEGESIVYGDTDSVYFTAAKHLSDGVTLDLDSATNLYDHISDEVSKTFPDFLKKDFNVPTEQGAVMQAGREVVGKSALFITKKRYAINVLDLEGWRPEGGKLKIMGMDIKRSDTPEFVQDFLEEILWDALAGLTEDSVIAKIKEFKKSFRELDPWRKGMPKRVNNLTPYTEKYERIKGMSTTSVSVKARRDGVIPKTFKEPTNNMIPGHVSASIQWNYLREMNGDQYSLKITDGMKVIVCKLRNNPMGYSSVAYPTDELKIPQWFKELPFDEDHMEETVLDKKIHNVLGKMGWDLTRINHSEVFESYFDF